MVDADAEHVPYVIWQVLLGLRQGGLYPAVEARALSQYPCGDLVGEPAVWFGKRGDRGVESAVEVLSGAHRPQDAECCLPRSRAGSHGQSRRPVVGLEGTAISRRSMRPAR